MRKRKIGGASHTIVQEFQFKKRQWFTDGVSTTRKVLKSVAKIHFIYILNAYTRWPLRSIVCFTWAVKNLQNTTYKES